MQPKACIFDLDGTLLDTLDDLANSVNEALHDFEQPQRTREEVRRFVGNGVRVLMRRAMGEGVDRETGDAIFERFLRVYEREKAHYTCPYEGVEEALAFLTAAGIRLAVLSNKNDDAVGVLCQKYFPDTFELTQGLVDGIRPKPAPDALLLICEKLGIRVEDAVYIGDSEVDVETAKSCGMRLVACDWGFRDKAVLEESGATTIISSPKDLKGLVRF